MMIRRRAAELEQGNEMRMIGRGWDLVVLVESYVDAVVVSFDYGGSVTYKPNDAVYIRRVATRRVAT